MLPGYAIDWNAWATFSAGLLAVGGAVIIGRKQLGITGRQTEILDRQTQIQAGQLQLQQLSLKIAVFERRMRVFEIMLRYIAKSKAGTTVTDDQSKEFFLVVAEARFLFTEPVFERLREWGNKCRVLEELRKKAPRDDNNKPEKTPEIGDLVEWMEQNANQFMNIFQDEINVSDISTPIKV